MTAAALDTYLELFESERTKVAAQTDALELVGELVAHSASLSKQAAWFGSWPKGLAVRQAADVVEGAGDNSLLRRIMGAGDDAASAGSVAAREGGYANELDMLRNTTNWQNPSRLADDMVPSGGAGTGTAGAAGAAGAAGDAAAAAADGGGRSGINPWVAGGVGLGAAGAAGAAGYYGGQHQAQKDDKLWRGAAYGGGLATGLAAPYMLRGVNQMVANQGLLPSGNYGGGGGGYDWTSI